VSTQVGYAGGSVPNPNYQLVCSDTTGHAEAVEVEYDPEQVTYESLLDLFWRLHDPTTPNRQGPNRGSQYRSVVFFHTPEQERAAQEAKAKLDASGKYRRKVVTEIVPAGAFWRAEEYHQKYYERRGVYSCPVPSR
jgi:peptide-methionine (S)-S-oxide reductase